MDEVYIVSFELEDREVFCLWYSDEKGKDSLLKDNNRILTFNSVEHINAYCIKNALPLSKNPTHKYNLNYIILEIENPVFSADKILDFWNIVEDISRTAGIEFCGNFLTDEVNNLYDKLFFASNIPAIRGNDPEYIPTWDATERELLMNIVHKGVLMTKEFVFY